MLRCVLAPQLTWEEQDMLATALRLQRPGWLVRKLPKSMISFLEARASMVPLRKLMNVKSEAEGNARKDGGAPLPLRARLLLVQAMLQGVLTHRAVMLHSHKMLDEVVQCVERLRDEMLELPMRDFVRNLGQVDRVMQVLSRVEECALATVEAMDVVRASVQVAAKAGPRASSLAAAAGLARLPCLSCDNFPQGWDSALFLWRHPGKGFVQACRHAQGGESMQLVVPGLYSASAWGNGPEYYWLALMAEDPRLLQRVRADREATLRAPVPRPLHATYNQNYLPYPTAKPRLGNEYANESAPRLPLSWNFAPGELVALKKRTRL